MLICQSVKRPDFGTIGPRIDFIASHYRLKKLPEISIYQYDVSIGIQGLKPDRTMPIRFGRCIVASGEVVRGRQEWLCLRRYHLPSPFVIWQQHLQSHSHF